MNRLLFILSLMSICLSCTPEESGVQDSTAELTASFAVSFPDAEAVWSAGDEINVNGFRYVTSHGGKAAVFRPTGTSPTSSGYIAVFPAESVVEGTEISGSYSQNHLVEETGIIDRDFLISAAKGEAGSNLSFQSLLSFICVTLHADGVQQVSFTANGEESLYGDYSVDFSGKTPVVSVSGGGKSVIISKSDGKPFSKGSKVYFATLPRTLKNGFTFTAAFGQEHGERQCSSGISDHTVLYRGQVLDLGAFYYDHDTGMGRLDISSDINVAVDCNAISQSPVSELLFGSYSEMHGGDLVPGICEQYIVNTSFEKWDSYGDLGETKNELVFTGSAAVPEDIDLAYPWEKRNIAGRGTFSVTTEDKCNTLSSQKVEVESGATAVLLQRLALPYYRINDYKVSFYAKVLGDVSMKVTFHDVGSRENTVLSDVYVPDISYGKWQEYTHEFVLSASRTDFNNRHAQYNLWIEISGSGTVYIDHATLFPADCVEGIFNPETIAYFKEYNVKAIRWPGGNYTSGYNWKNGVGAWIDRPCLKNKAWGGLDSNFLGTDEIVRFCKLTGAELVMGVGYNTSVMSEQDIVDWVEYCHDKGYDVKYWGIGNEVYGGYQLGHVSASSYSAGLVSIVDQIRAIDPGVRILASGRGVHNYYRNSYPGWTETVYSSASSSFDLLDCHMYVYGNDASNPMNLSGEEFFRIFAAANLHFRDFIEYFRKTAPDKKLALLEWGVLPKLSGNSYATPQRQTFANLLISACEYHEMIRNSDVVELAAMHNFSFYIAPHKLHSEPVNARTVLLKELSSLSGGYNIPVDDSIFPAYAQNVNYLDVGVRSKVTELDMVAVLKGDVLYLSCVNRSLTDELSVVFNLIGAVSEGINGYTYTSDRPFARSLWDNVVQTKMKKADITGDTEVSLPPLSYTILELQLKNY